MPRVRDLDPARYALPPELTARLFSPALVVYLDEVRRNVRWVLQRTGGPERWRPHVKTTKIPEVWAELVRAGVRRFKCATTREAARLLEVLAAEGARGDVVLAYPLVGPALAHLGELARRHPEARLSVLVEDPAAVPAVPEELGILVDVDPDMRRTGVPLDDVETVAAVGAAAGARFGGVHLYDGHLTAGTAAGRRAEIHALYARAVELIEALEGRGLGVGELVTSGTPSFLAALDYAPFRDLGGTAHRVSPGTVVFHDLRSEEENEDLDLAPAALVLARVVSHPGERLVTCDAGSKAVAAEAGTPCAAVLGRPELVARVPHEEHLPFEVTRGERPPRGTELLLVPRHVCPTVNLAEEAVLMEGGAVRAVVPVAARSHELFAPGAPRIW